MYEIFYRFKRQKNPNYITGILLEKDEDEQFQFWVAQKSTQTNGTLYKKWMFPQKKDKTASDKPYPWIIPLGNHREAIEMLRYFLEQLENSKG